MSKDSPSENQVSYLGDERMLDLAKKLIEHVLKNTAIRDCNCSECGGFKEEAPQWLEMLTKRARLT